MAILAPIGTSWGEYRTTSVRSRLHAAPSSDEDLPLRATLADVDDNEFLCAFVKPDASGASPARAFTMCPDHDRPEVAAWWA